MHHFQTTLGNETTVAAPQAGELLAGNAIGAWAPVEANTHDQIMVLTQRLNETPQWQELASIHDHQFTLQHQAIDDPKAPDFGIPAVQEIQIILLQILEALRNVGVIAE